jgi:hypothetical protein
MELVWSISWRSNWSQRQDYSSSYEDFVWYIFLHWKTNAWVNLGAYTIVLD